MPAVYWDWYNSRYVGDTLRKIDWVGEFDIPGVNLTYSEWCFEVYRPGSSSIYLENVNYDERTWEGDYMVMMHITEYPYYNSIFDVAGDWLFKCEWYGLTPNLGLLGTAQATVNVTEPPLEIPQTPNVNIISNYQYMGSF